VQEVIALQVKPSKRTLVGEPKNNKSFSYGILLYSNVKLNGITLLYDYLNIYNEKQRVFFIKKIKKKINK